MRSLLVLLAVGCARSAPPAAPVREASLFVVSDTAFGPVGASTPATLVALRRAFAGYDVNPVNRDLLEYRVTKAGTRMFDVIPDEEGTILNIHVATPKLVVGGYRVGESFAGGATTCECWADQTVCFQEGEHVAVALAKVCREGIRKAPAGLAITATIWSARPLVAGGATP